MVEPTHRWAWRRTGGPGDGLTMLGLLLRALALVALFITTLIGFGHMEDWAVDVLGYLALGLLLLGAASLVERL